MDKVEQLDVSDKPVTVPLGDGAVQVKPAMDWLTEAFSALLKGDAETWATTSLVDYTEWKSLRPTMRQMRDFIEAYKEITGSDPGKSRPSLS